MFPMPKSSPKKSHTPVVTKIVQKKSAAITSLCREFHVEELYLFGSAASGDFRRLRSDIDFLVRFKSSTPADHADRYFGLLAGLRDLFHRRIDLIEIGALKNPYFRESAEANRVLLYEA
jgi:predicted nucleotidyltransferase